MKEPSTNALQPNKCTSPSSGGKTAWREIPHQMFFRRGDIVIVFKKSMTFVLLNFVSICSMIKEFIFRDRTRNICFYMFGVEKPKSCALKS